MNTEGRGSGSLSCKSIIPTITNLRALLRSNHATEQLCDHTTIVREYPKEFGPGAEPYYPIPTRKSEVLYRRYKQLSSEEENVSFVGRLARYRYFNMDQVTAMALKEFDRISERYGSA